jgi:hypothetical protein
MDGIQEVTKTLSFGDFIELIRGDDSFIPESEYLVPLQTPYNHKGYIVFMFPKEWVESAREGY